MRARLRSFVPSRWPAGAAAALALAFGGASPTGSLPPDLLSVGGTYETRVSLIPGRNSCGAVAVQDNQTVVGHAPGASTLSLTHVGNAYAGTIDSTGHFTTVPKTLGGGEARYTLAISGQFTRAGFDDTVRVNVKQVAAPPACGYDVRWVGTKVGALNSIPANADRSDAPASSLSSPAEFWRTRQLADSLSNAGNAASAAPLYWKLASADTTDVQLWLGAASASLAAGAPTQAERAFIHVLSGGYFPGPVAVQIARLAAQSGNRSGALAWLDSAVAYHVASRSSFQRDSAFAGYQDDPRFRALAGMLPSRHFARDDGWRYDLAYFAAEARRLHTGFDRPALSRGFGSAVADLDRTIPRLSDDQVLAGLQHLATLLGDGHSGVYRRTLPRAHRRLPIELYDFAEGMFIVGARQDHRDLIGSRVVRIGAKTPDEALTALAPYVPRDNPMRMLAVGVPFELLYPFQLHAIGAIADTTSVTMTLQEGGTGGRLREVRLVADDSRAPQQRLMPLAASDSNPLWLRHVADNVWFTPLATSSAVYVQYNAVADTRTQTVEQAAARLRQALRDTTVHNLIIDVRRNGGGNSSLNRPLHLVGFAFAQAAANHRIWVLAGRHTFSAAQNFVNYVERFTDAVFVGEPTGSRPNFTGENGEVILPYSGVIAEISNANHWSSSWEDQRPWIAPTVPVPLTAAGYFANRDPVLEAVIQMIGQAH